MMYSPGGYVHLPYPSAPKPKSKAKARAKKKKPDPNAFYAMPLQYGIQPGTPDIPPFAYGGIPEIPPYGEYAAYGPSDVPPSGFPGMPVNPHMHPPVSPHGIAAASFPPGYPVQSDRQPVDPVSYQPVDPTNNILNPGSQDPFGIAVDQPSVVMAPSNASVTTSHIEEKPPRPSLDAREGEKKQRRKAKMDLRDRKAFLSPKRVDTYISPLTVVSLLALIGLGLGINNSGTSVKDGAK